ncbi:acyltransferase family protein [Corynebacterium hansenii]|uniref:Acyltransferase family protein n=1 Tax=Corynebacterium hansenii TaxID=394964 RepID=A0ABV7ZQ03_9CORY|nr:acyltransferase [Corynebacterium hansenii]WJZ01193.1 Acyltransferase family protein [Corynebacterium hansenii]
MIVRENQALTPDREESSASGRPRPEFRPAFRPGFLPALEGLRAVASLGIIGTHVAFQTGHDVGAMWERMLGRFDFFVAVFFTLSGFLLWRSHRAGMGGVVWRRRRDGSTTGEPGSLASGWAKYYRKRAARILPAYWVLVVVVLIALPVGKGADLGTWLTNLTLTQVFFADSLHGGLTHLWSLSVEVSFYVALPLFAIALRGLDPMRRQGARIVALAGLAVLSFGWAWLPLPYPDGVNPHIQPAAYFSWFAAGMIFAELESLAGSESARAREVLETAKRIARLRWLWVGVAVAALWLAAFMGPEGLVELSNWEFLRRTWCGLVFGAAIIGPWAIAPESRILTTPVMQALGRWSYGIFLWHMAMLSVAFPLLGVRIFDGHIVMVWLLTVALTVPLAAASYALVEEPARRWLGRVWASDARTTAPAITS